MNIHTRVVSAALLAAVLATTGAVRADAPGAQFAAETLRRAPDGQVVAGKMFVGDGRTRMELSQQGQELVRISDRKGGKEWILFPADKTYLERGAPPGAATPPAAPTAETDPCTGVVGMTCRRLGTEELNGRPAVKWEMTLTDQGKTLTATQWLDVQRPGLPLKQVMPNGQTTELKQVGSEAIEGRPTEKWQMTQAVPNQPPVVSFQWYDPQLKLAVREEVPGGFVFELKNIRVGAQPDDLFAVPAGYTRKTPPQGAPAPAAAGQPVGK